MISCTEFIPLYSELFKYIDNKGGGHDAVERYWVWVGEEYLRFNLEPLVREKGLAGAWEYWTRSLSEEACDVKYVYDQDKQEIISHMRHCPSKGRLLEMEHMEPYYDYCGHCAVLYKKTLEDNGILCGGDYSGVDHAECRSIKYLAKNGAPSEGWNKMD